MFGLVFTCKFVFESRLRSGAVTRALHSLVFEMLMWKDVMKVKLVTFFVELIKCSIIHNCICHLLIYLCFVFVVSRMLTKCTVLDR